MHKIHLPIANPCHEDWDAMRREPDARRFCDQCDKSVHDLSAMTERAAKDLLSAPRSGRICIRYKTDARGRVRFSDPTAAAPTPSRFAGWRAGLATAAAAFALAGCADANRAPSEVTPTHCNYEVGPFGYTLQRGEGNCPPTESVNSHEIDDPEVMGKVAIDPEPEAVVGELVAVEPEPVPEMGEAPPLEEPEELMGDVAEVPHPEPTEVMGQAPAPEPREIMGDWAGPDPAAGNPDDAPCEKDGPGPAPEPDAGPQRF